MGGKMSRNKGARAERYVKQVFADWWGVDFHRTPGSGSFATTTKNMPNVSGDVATHDSSFPFCVEVKNVEGWHLEQLFTAPECDIVQWWRQAKEQCPDDQIPLLIFTRNHQPYYFVMPQYFVNIDGWSIVIDGDEVVLGLLDHLVEDTATCTWEEVKDSNCDN